ncbi:MAG: 2Fe-2S iron-sulfur cluster binding domain-containing protein [Anaerolineales bacterium]|nr:2Fe-2S iron-sulfur cluster binding domain-containing protein [Anaerolineales bacterium]
MTEVVNLTIDGQAVSVPKGTSILQAAASVGINIPTICYHPTLTPPAVCRLCTVEVEKQRVLQPACVVQAAEGMVVKTDSERVRTGRKVILELLASTVDLHDAPEIQGYIQRYGADTDRFTGGVSRQERFEVYNDNPFYIRDYSQCVMCWRCIQVCADDVQHTYALTWGQRGINSHVATFFNEDMPDTTCVFCGNCVGVCPTGALKGVVEWKLENVIARP